MATAKEKITEIIGKQPDDATYEEILRELALERMVDRGMEDARKGRTLDDEAMARRIQSWPG